MEDTLRVACRDLYANSYNSLNPCFNGRYSQRAKLSLFPCLVLCLNPCFNGRYSQRDLRQELDKADYSLNPCFNGRYSQRLMILAVFWMKFSS